MLFENLITKLEQLPVNDFADFDTLEIIENHDSDIMDHFTEDGVFDNYTLASFIKHSFIEDRQWELETIEDNALHLIKVGLAGEWDVFRYHELQQMIAEDENRIDYLENHDGIYWLDFESENSYKLTNKDIIDYLNNLKKLKLI